MAFCCRCKMKLVDGIIFLWIVDLRAVTALVSKLRLDVNGVIHPKWEDWEEEQGPDRDVTQFLIIQVKYTNNTVWPPVGDNVFPNLSSKFSQGCWGSPFRGHALRR